MCYVWHSHDSSNRLTYRHTVKALALFVALVFAGAAGFCGSMYLRHGTISPQGLVLSPQSPVVRAVALDLHRPELRSDPLPAPKAIVKVDRWFGGRRLNWWNRQLHSAVPGSDRAGLLRDRAVANGLRIVAGDGGASKVVAATTGPTGVEP